MRNYFWAIFRLVSTACVYCIVCIPYTLPIHTLPCYAPIGAAIPLELKLLWPNVHALVFEPKKKIVIACVIELWNEENRNIERIRAAEFLKYTLNNNNNSNTHKKNILQEEKTGRVCVCVYVRTQKPNIYTYNEFLVFVSRPHFRNFQYSILWFWCSVAQMSMNALRWPYFCCSMQWEMKRKCTENACNVIANRENEFEIALHKWKLCTWSWQHDFHPLFVRKILCVLLFFGQYKMRALMHSDSACVLSLNKKCIRVSLLIFSRWIVEKKSKNKTQCGEYWQLSK